MGKENAGLLVTALIVGVAYYAGVWAGFATAFPDLGGVRRHMFWPPNVILMVALLVTPTRWWWPCSLTAFAAHLLAHAQLGLAPTVMALPVQFAGNALQAVLAAFTLRRLSDRPWRVDTLRSMIAMIAVAGVAAPALVSALVIQVYVWAGWMPDFLPAWGVRFLANAVSTITLAPLLLTVAGHGLWRLQDIAPWRAAEFVALLAGLVVVETLVSHSARSGAQLPLLYAPLPLLLWAAVRFGSFGLCITLVATLLLFVSPFFGGPSVTPLPADNTITLVVFLIGIAIPLLLFAALIEERRANEEALRESEDRFRTMANSAPVMIWMSGPDKLFTFFNKRWLDFTGRNIRQEIGNGWSEGIHPDDVDHCVGIYVNAFDARQEFTMEYRLRRYDGEYCWVLNNGVPRFESDGTFLGYIGSAIDITERKRAEERFRLAVEASPSAIVMINPKGEIVLVNNLTEKLFGYSREELIGKFVEVLVPERFRAGHPAHRTGFFAAPQSRAMGAGRDLFAKRKDGTEFQVEIGLNPIQTNDGTFVLTAIVDITERKRTESELRRQREELAHVTRVSTVGELTTSVAHELNQPLGAILSNAEAAEMFLTADPPALDEVREILADIRKDDQRAGEVIRRMRALLRKQELAPKSIEINEAVEEVLKLLSIDASARKVAVKFERTAGLPRVWCDPVHFQQVVLNLVLNGMEAMVGLPEKNRQVVVRTGPGDNGTVKIAVADSGPGIPVDGLPKLFEPFFTTKKEGVGMGLSIARTIVEAHHGQIWAENNSGAGATFYFTVPVSKEAPA